MRKPSRQNWDTSVFWEYRYRTGGTSGAGSVGENAVMKADHVNEVIESERVSSIIDWGVGDGVVLSHITEKIDYIGVDVSPTIVRTLRQTMGHRGQFVMPAKAWGGRIRAEMAISLDVLQHLIIHREFRRYMANLFGSAERLVLIYGTDRATGRTSPHVRRRQWTPYVEGTFDDWELVTEDHNPDIDSFYLYRRKEDR